MKNSKFVYTFLILVSISLSSCLSSGNASRQLASNGVIGGAAAQNIDVYFTPWDDAETAIIDAVNKAQQRIYIQAYTWTSKPITDAVIKAKNRGVKVFMLTDKDQMQDSTTTQVPALAKAGVRVSLEVKYQNAHNKIILIDPQQLTGSIVTGSYNFTYSAQHRNAENVLIIRNPQLAQTYLNNWKRHEKDSLPY